MLDKRGMVVVWAGDLFASLFSVLRSLSGQCPAQDDTAPSAVDGVDPIAVSQREGSPPAMAIRGRGDGVVTIEQV